MGVNRVILSLLMNMDTEITIDMNYGITSGDLEDCTDPMLSLINSRTLINITKTRRPRRTTYHVVPPISTCTHAYQPGDECTRSRRTF